MKFSESNQQQITTDPRFSNLPKDPRFIRPRHKHTKIKLDPRFKHVLSSKEFEFVQKVDKYGRPAALSRERVNLKKYYREDDSDVQKSDDEEKVESDYEEKENEEVKEKGKFVDYARGKALMESSSEESDNEETDKEDNSDTEENEEENEVSSNSEIEDDQVVQLNAGNITQGDGIVDAEEILQQHNIPVGEETRRIAVVNMDWDVVKAGDLMKLFDAFKPASGVIHSVSIYPSSFGKERLADEERRGPPSEIFQTRDDDASNSNEESNEESNSESNDLFESTDAVKDEFNQSQLRKYQLERMRYYYAVIECDSVSTAKAIYDQCDGSEYESSGIFMDLRYIPNDTQFDDEEPRDKCLQVPSSFKPKDFVASALQHSKVKLTWDEDDQDRLMVTRRKFTKDDLKDLDFKAYLASDIDDSSDGEDREASKSKYLALLKGPASDNESEADEQQENEDNDKQYEDMEITFAPGLSDLANKLLEAKREKSLIKNETVFETYLREKREKKKEKKRLLNKEDNSSDSDRGMENDEFFKDAFGPEFDNPNETTETTEKKKNKRKLGNEEEKDNSLELLFMDETDTNRKHFDMDAVLKAEKGKKSKKRKQDKQMEEEDRDEFAVNVEDERFKALFDSSEYAIDPTSAKFKKTRAMQRLLEERRGRNAAKNVAVAEKAAATSETGKKSNSQLQSLVQKIKQTSSNANALKGKRK